MNNITKNIIAGSIILATSIGANKLSKFYNTSKQAHEYIQAWNVSWPITWSDNKIKLEDIPISKELDYFGGSLRDVNTAIEKTQEKIKEKRKLAEFYEFFH